MKLNFKIGFTNWENRILVSVRAGGSRFLKDVPVAEYFMGIDSLAGFRKKVKVFVVFPGATVARISIVSPYREFHGFSIRGREMSEE